MTAIVTDLKSNWSFTQVGGGQGTAKNEWLPVSQFPTTVHVELLKLGKIPDPFVGLNEWDVQWIGEKEWSFKTNFSIKPEDVAFSSSDLVFEGLDTFATVQLNGQELIKTENQFVAYRVSTKDALKAGTNELVISFASAFLKGKELEKKNGKFVLWNGDSSRLHVRKAQYNYGWDWGPVLMTVGPWRAISIHHYEVRITDLFAKATVDSNLASNLDVIFTVSKNSTCNASIILETYDGSSIISSQSLQAIGSDGEAHCSFKSKEINLWYPIGYGNQTRYNVIVQITDSQGNVLDSKKQTVGFRRAKIIQDQLIDQEGRTFLFEINNIRIFCGGSNWIPADNFLTTVTPDIYKAWLQLLVDGNQNMIRVWGGGIYEPDVFYDLCDELGILVWQDFMFGCGQYPAYDSLLDLIRVEAEQNVKRLRHHPSLVIFAGNNEDYQVAEQCNLELDYSDEISDFRKTTFPARYIYERLLPKAVEEFSDIYYHRSSPYSGFGKPTTDKTYGDLHQWNVWHGSQEPWHNWDILAGRFVSEFGMEGYPNIRTVDYWLGGDTTERFPQSRIMNSHNKADGFERRLELYLVENFRHTFDMESYVYYTQIMQAETLASAYRLWRRNWKGLGREYTAGALVWQLNDCWPVTSWAIVDYFLRPKPAYYTIARELRVYTVGMTRKEKKVPVHEDSAAYYTIETTIEIWGTNKTLQEKEAVLEFTAFDLHSDWSETWEKKVSLAANSATELWKGELPGQPKRSNVSQVPKVIIVSARLLDGGVVLGRYSNWPEPFKFIKFPSVDEVALKVDYLPNDLITLSCGRPIKGIVLDVDGEEVKWSDQAIDLVPKDPQTVKATGLNGRKIKVRYLGDGSA